jgi:basic membrane protein A and related proteins
MRRIHLSKHHVWRWLIVAVAALSLSVVAAGCGGDDEDDGGAAATTATETGGGGEKISVGMVTDTGGVNDHGFNEFSIKGFEQAKEELGIEGRVYVSKTADDYLPNLTAAAEDGHDLVISIGYKLAGPAIEVAQKFPETSFAGIDHFYGGETCAETKTCEQPNALGMVYPTEEAGYLAGVLAAKLTKSKSVSTVGGEKIPPVDNWIAGFQQGLIDTDPSVKFVNAYSQTFVDQAKCKEIALDQISRGSDIVFQVAGDCGLGAIDAACEQGKMAIGVDADQSAQGDCVVTSALKPLTNSVFEVIETFQNGDFKGGTNNFYGVEQLPDAPLLAPYTGAVSADAKSAVEAAQEELANGGVDPPATIEEVKKA